MSDGPDFIGIGMERAGSSWIFYMLASHPEIWVPPLKELHYFDSVDPEAVEDPPRYSRHLPSRIKHKIAPFLKGQLEKRPEIFKMDYLNALAWDKHYFLGLLNDEWYRGIFDKKFTNGRICGEITPAYSTLSDQLVSDVCKNFPKAVFILSLRNPVSRLRSGLVHYFVVQRGRALNDVTAEEMIEWLEGDTAQSRSSIFEILNKWLTHAGADRLHLMNFSDVKNNPEGLVKALYQRLGVDSTVLPHADEMGGKVNTYTPENLILPDGIHQKIAEIGEAEIQKVEKMIPAIVAQWHKESEGE